MPAPTIGRALDAVRGEAGPRAAARFGYAARGVFYLTLALLTARIAVLPDPQPARNGRQPDAQGALELLARSVLGQAALAVAAAGFVALGLVRIAAAWRDERPGRLRRASVLGQGVFYLLVAVVPASFLAGDTAAGSEQQHQRSTAQLLGLPGGAVVVVAVGLGLLGTCAWQLRGVWTQDFTDGLRLRGRPQWLRRLVRVTGTVGIVGRTLVFLPLGVFLIVAAFTADPGQARGLDGELLALAGHAWGKAALAAVALLLAVFALYSFLEGWLRDVGRSV